MGRACENQCGWSAFGAHTTCCRQCRGPTGPHSSDCFRKNARAEASDAPVPLGRRSPDADSTPATAASRAEDTDLEGRGGPKVGDREDMFNHRPYFIVCHSVGVFLLWLGAAVAEEGVRFPRALAGLETIFPGRTILTIHRDCEDLRFEVYRWFTYQFTHANFFHVTANALANLIVGVPLGWFQGSLRMFCIFYVGVFGGAMGFLLSNGHHKGLVGMSAGTYALWSFRLADLFMNWAETRWRKIVLSSLVLVLVVEVANVQLVQSDEGDQGTTSYSAHIGGGVAGLLLGIAISKNIRSPTFGWEWWTRIASLGLGLFCSMFCIAWILNWPPRTIWDPAPWCWARQVHNTTLFQDNAWHCVRCQSDDCIREWSLQTRIENVSPAICDNVVGWASTEA